MPVRGVRRLVATGAAAVALTTILSSTAGHAAVILDKLLVRIYDNAGVLPEDRARALARANEILARADLDAAWLECPARTNRRLPRACNVPAAHDEIVVRLVRAPAQAARHQSPKLGYSLIDAETGTGTLATIFIDRVDQLSQRAQFDRAAVLARAIAHEIGHLMLGTNDHSRAGLMREVWTFEEVRLNRQEDWHFSPTEVNHMHAARLAGAPSARTAVKPRNGAAGTGGQNPRTLLDKTP
jgi:hypothetical protein